MLGVPRQLFRQGVLGIEVKVAEQTLAPVQGHVANGADAVLVVARSGGVAFGMIHVHFGVFVERCGLGQRLGQVGSAVARFQPQHLDAADYARLPIHAHRHAA